MTSTALTAQRLHTIVVIPCHNEARRLEIPAYCEFLAASPDVTLLFVDDGSIDDTPLVLERLRQDHPRQVNLLRLGANVGKAEAVRRGVQVALRRRPAFVGYWDADLATPLEAIPQLVSVLEGRPGLQLVMGSRVALLGRCIKRNVWRHFAGRAFATAASLVLRLPVYDTQCGAKVFRVTQATTELFSRPFEARWIFDVEILARIVTDDTFTNGSVSVEKLIYEFPLENWQDVSGTRLKLQDAFVAAYDLAAIHWRYRRHGMRPKKVSLTVGPEVRRPAA